MKIGKSFHSIRKPSKMSKKRINMFREMLENYNGRSHFKKKFQMILKTYSELPKIKIQKKRRLKGMLYPRGNSKLMCYKLPTILRKIFRKFGLNFVPIIILSRKRISTLRIDPIHKHPKFQHCSRYFHTTVTLFVLWK